MFYHNIYFKNLNYLFSFYPKLLNQSTFDTLYLSSTDQEQMHLKLSFQMKDGWQPYIHPSEIDWEGLKGDTGDPRYLR